MKMEPLRAGTYQCYRLSGGALNYMFMDVHFRGAASYRDKRGKAGKLIFESGPYTSANAAVLPGPKIGLNMKGGSFFNATSSRKQPDRAA